MSVAPMTRNVDPSRDPYIVMRCHMIEEALEAGEACRVADDA